MISNRKEWMKNLQQGALVYPKKEIYLTPARDHEIIDWPLWRQKEIGIVLPYEEKQVGILVLAPSGVGLCFFDEICEIK